MIEVKNLYKSFGDKEVLKNISTVFEDGKTNLIIGQSGAGKTVLMRCVTGLMIPTSGEVLYDGRNFVNLKKKLQVQMRREMGMIFQSAALFDSQTVLENVRFPLDMFSNMTLRERQKRAMECLDRVNLTGAEDKFPGEISGGMQKRVAIARAIVMKPKYLFCDEPNSGLDPKTSLVIDELLTDITHELNTTTIINTHDMNSVMGIGENIVFIAHSAERIECLRGLRSCTNLLLGEVGQLKGQDKSLGREFIPAESDSLHCILARNKA